MFFSQFMPCDSCGESLKQPSEGHRCDPERQADYQMFALREEVADLVPQIERFLDTPLGRFESWVAARQVRRAA